jgi:hypothetical protein
MTDYELDSLRTEVEYATTLVGVLKARRDRNELLPGNLKSLERWQQVIDMWRRQLPADVQRAVGLSDQSGRVKARRWGA